MSRAKALRRARYGQVAALTANVGTLAFNLVVSPWVALVPLACIIALALAIWMTTRTIRRREYLDRPRPDYAAIAAMEREVYGETFRHEGSIASMFLPPELHPLVTPEVPPGLFETIIETGRERIVSPKPSRCYCSWCRGRAGVHGDEAKAMYQAEVAAAMAQCRDLRWERHQARQEPK
jgi:hypothetical protein